jgi:16S rRNA processing protein RimM
LKKPADNAQGEFLAVARIVRPQGRYGEVVAEILTDFPQRFRDLRSVFLETPGTAPTGMELERTWQHKGRIVLKFRAIDSIEKASALRGRLVLVPFEDRSPLPLNHYYLWELRGCRVLQERQGETAEVGTVTEVESTGGVDLLHVETPRGEVLIPFAQEICKRIDTQAKTIVINPPEDLLDLNL